MLAMNTHFFIKNNFVHLWRANLSHFIPKLNELLALLSPDELKRAERLISPLHKERFIIARGLLRKTLGLYLNQQGEAITFSYGAHGKPFLHGTPLKFNLSHSDDMVVLALTIEKEIGIDIEKIDSHFKNDVAKRLFSPEEYQQLLDLSERERIPAFYRIWARKEAIIKVLGLGLYAPLKDFTVSSKNQIEEISFNLNNHIHEFLVQSIAANPQYEAAFAVHSPIDQMTYWQWTAECVPEQLSHF